MNEATISIRLDSKDKIDFEKLCKNIGMTVSTALNVFIKKSISEQEIPVTLSANKREKAWNNLQTIVKNTKVDLPKNYDYKEEYRKWLRGKQCK